MKKYLIAAVVVVVATVGYMYLSSGPVDVEQVDSETALPMEGDAINEALEAAGLDYEKTQFAQLKDVSGGNASGAAWILRDGGALYHFVLADLPDPEGGNVYEGWLVKKFPTLQFFSTGVMVKTNEGYGLNFTAAQEYEGFDDVVITLETVVDETPEAHILEGTVQ